MNKVYVAATRQNDGKTITCLGLISAFIKRVPKVGYIKPVGQRYQEIGGHKIDEDAVLMKDVFGLNGDVTDMSPLAIERGFTERYIENPNPEALAKSITSAYDRVAIGKDVVLVEGTGHAGVGSVFDMSNGDVARLLGARVIIVSSGGIGRPIDEIMLNKAMFDQSGVEVIGAIVNKVQANKYEKVNTVVRKGLERKGIRVLGVMPYRPVLSNPTIAQVMSEINGELLSGKEGLGNSIGKMVIGAMAPHEALDYFTSDALLITPGTREDNILAAMSSCVVGGDKSNCVSGIVLTGGSLPHHTVMELIRHTTIPVILAEDDTFSVATKIDKLNVKIRAGDEEKIKASEDLIEEFVDVQQILDMLH